MGRARGERFALTAQQGPARRDYPSSAGRLARVRFFDPGRMCDDVVRPALSSRGDDRRLLRLLPVTAVCCRCGQPLDRVGHTSVSTPVRGMPAGSGVQPGPGRSLSAAAVGKNSPARERAWERRSRRLAAAFLLRPWGPWAGRDRERAPALRLLAERPLGGHARLAFVRPAKCSTPAPGLSSGRGLP
jgi:hypothetical protein